MSIEKPAEHGPGHELSLPPGALTANLYGVPPGMGEVRDAIILDPGRVLRAYEEQYRLARTDTTTGLPNRLAWNERLNQLNDDAEVSGPRPFGLLLFDLDRFKTVNEALGHDVGDSLLQAVAGAVRRSDEVYRLGGDEFGVLLMDDSPRNVLLEKQPEPAPAPGAGAARTPLTRLGAAADRIRELILPVFDTPAYEEFRLDVSIGWATWDDGMSIQELVKAADLAVKEAKREHQAEERRNQPILIRVAGGLGRILLRVAGEYDDRLHG